MNIFWEKVIKPTIDLKKPKHIVEVGADKGINTALILEYCQKNGARLSSIDPAPQFNVDKLKEKYGERFDFYKDLSLNALPSITGYDVILIDGDHNWYTVYNELKTVEKTFGGQNFPVIFLHDTCWPYARRDLYYVPETIPADYRHPYKKLGIIPGKSELCETGGLNANYLNATEENTPKNGVYIAVEDFIKESKRTFYLHTYNALHGLTIIAAENDHKLYDYFKSLYNDVIDISENAFISCLIALSDLYTEKNELLRIQNDLFSLINEYDSQLSKLTELLPMRFNKNEVPSKS